MRDLVRARQMQRSRSALNRPDLSKAITEIESRDPATVGCAYCGGTDHRDRECGIELPPPEGTPRKAVNCARGDHFNCCQRGWCTCRCHVLPEQPVTHPTWWQIERAEQQPDDTIRWVHCADAQSEGTAIRILHIQRWLTRAHRWQSKHQHTNNRAPKEREATDV